MRTLIVALGAALICGAGLALADGGCDYQGKGYMNGSDVCQAGTRYQCKNGGWEMLGTACSLQSALSQASCEYLGESYPSGRVTCQSGMQQRCEQGQWQSLGTHCGDEAVVAFSGFVALAVDQETCVYRGAQFQAQTTLCRNGKTYLCEGGGWNDEGTPCE